MSDPLAASLCASPYRACATRGGAPLCKGENGRVEKAGFLSPLQTGTAAKRQGGAHTPCHSKFDRWRRRLNSWLRRSISEWDRTA